MKREFTLLKNKKISFEKFSKWFTKVFLSIALVLISNVCSNAVGIRWVQITSIIPSKDIECGTPGKVGIAFRYVKQANEHNDISIHVHLYENINWWSDKLLASGVVNILASFRKDSVINTALDINCNSNPACLLCGNVACSNSNPVPIYASILGEESVNDTAACVTIIAYAVKPRIIPKSPVKPGDTADVKIELSNSVPLLGFDYVAKWDQSKFTFANAFFDPEFIPLFNSYSISQISGGMIKFSGTFLHPQIILSRPRVATLKLIANNNSPYGNYPIQVDTSSKFFDTLNNSVVANLGSQFLTIIPFDTTHPNFNLSKIFTTDTSIVGIADAVSDNYGYLECRLYIEDSLNIGYSVVNDDGSFEIVNHFLRNEPIKLIARDGVGNESEYEFDYVLPVELRLFVSTVYKNEVTLTWTTSQEQNNAGFDIERKLTGATEWSKAGFVHGKGTTGELVNYSFKDEKLNSGRYNYRLKQTDFNGNYKYFNLSNEVIVSTPGNFTLSQNYPNPFNPITRIDYELSISKYVRLKIYNVTGKEVAGVIDQKQEAGYYSVLFDGSNLPSGIYFYELRAGDFKGIKRMVLIK